MTTLVAQESKRSLEGAEKVAALLLALERETAQRVLKHFDQHELRRIARLAAGLGAVSPTMLEGIYNELIEEISNGEIDLVGDATQAENLLAGVMPEDAVADIMSDLRGSSNEYFWRRIVSLPEKTLADYIKAEHPQTIAVVVGRLDPGFAARVLSHVPGSLRSQVMRRMLRSRPVSDPVLRAIETALQEVLFAVSSAPTSSEVNARVAGIINQLERDQIEEILQGITESEPLIAAQLKSLLFSFEDIVRLSQRARSILFDQLPTERVILALRGADAAVRDAVLPCLSNRTRRMVEAELASNANPPKREIVAAQRQIAEAVLRLADQGVIEIAETDEAVDASE